MTGADSMKRYAGILIASLSMFAGAIPVMAHHSFAAEYDANKPVTITGTVTKVEWMNPHARFYVDVKAADGKITNWNFELGAIPVLLKQGWRKDSLKEGDQVTVEGSRAKDGSLSANARRVSLPDGRKVFAGSSAPTADQ
jgi:DNA/RNA endonuclease YhcR with UshA esterase domain